MIYKVYGTYQYRVYKYIEADSKDEAIHIACQGQPLHEWAVKTAYKEDVESAIQTRPDKTVVIKEDFPFEEIRTKSGDFFHTLEEVKALGYTEDQIWSVVIADTDEGYTYSYGPCEHWIDRLGYVATKEKHDGNTYYEETMESEA